MQFVILLLLQLLGTDVAALGSTASMAVSVAAMYLAAFPVCLALLRRIPSSPLPREEREPMSFWSLLLCLVVCIGVMEAGNLIGNGLMGITSLFLDRQIDNTVVDMVLAGELIPVILFAAILAPIFEELLFRKLLIDRIRVFGDRTCILVSGVMFGLIHGNFYQFFYACGLGMVFAYVYLRTGRVRNTIRPPTWPSTPWAGWWGQFSSGGFTLRPREMCCRRILFCRSWPWASTCSPSWHRPSPGWCSSSACGAGAAWSGGSSRFPPPAGFRRHFSMWECSCFS